MQKDFIKESPDSDAGSATVSVTTTANTNTAARSVVITCDVGGISRTVLENQSAFVFFGRQTARKAGKDLR